MKPGLIFVLALCPLAAFGQARLQLQLDHLKEKAEEVVNVNIDGALLDQGLQLLSSGKEAGETGALSGMQGVYVRSYKFAKPGSYTEADVNSIRKQLSAPGWTPLVEVTEKNGDNVWIYSYVDKGKPAGMVVLAAEAKELTVVNIVGSLDISKLSKLGGKLGIPAMKMGPVQKDKPEKEKELEKEKAKTRREEI